MKDLSALILQLADITAGYAGGTWEEGTTIHSHLLEVRSLLMSAHHIAKDAEQQCVGLAGENTIQVGLTLHLHSDKSEVDFSLT